MEEPKELEKRNINTGGGNYNERIEGDYIQGNVEIILDKLNKSSRTPYERNFLTEIINQVYKALDNKILVDLNVTISPDNVNPILMANVPNTSETVQITLNSTMTILNVFSRNDIKGHLLILGQAGGGKTITMLNLQKNLIDKAINDENFPIPVYFNLSSWKNQNQSMSNWVVDELFLKFGVEKPNAKEWIENKKILPLLDGLDEVNSVLQILCIQAINNWIASSTPNKPLYIVVSCRKKQYDTLMTHLNLYNSIVLEPLTDKHIKEYLLNNNNIKKELWDLLQKNNKLLELVKKPFLFGIAFVSYKKMSGTLEDKTSLFNAYEKEMFDRWKKKRSTKSKTSSLLLEKKIEKRLIFLAKKLQKEPQNEYKEREFLIENIRLKWLYDNDISDKNKSILIKIYVLIFRIIILIIFSFSLIPFPNIDIKTAVICSLILGFFIGTDEYSLNEQTVINWEIMHKINWIKYRNKFLNFLIEYTSIGIVSGLILGLLLHIFHDIIKPILLLKLIIFSIIIAVIFGLIVKVVRVKDNSDTTTRISPNQGIKTTIQNAISVFLIVGMICGAIFSFMAKNIQWSIVGLPVGLATGLHYGGFACIQHFILRLILYSQGYIPWNYAQFLKDCTELMFIQRVGGRYLFIHEMLRDHFVNKDSIKTQ